MKRVSGLLILWFFLVSIGIADAKPIFVEGKDYVVLPKQAQLAAGGDLHTVVVTEFFSYGCPWCYKIEKSLDNWKKRLPSGVKFSRVPVIYERGWDVYAKAYVAADILGIENVLSKRIFAKIHDDKDSLDTNKAMIRFFISNGIKEKVANSAFLSSPTVDNRVKAGMQLMQLFRINAVPSLVINNHYRIDIAMMDGDEQKLFSVASFLIAKELASDLMRYK